MPARIHSLRRRLHCERCAKSFMDITMPNDGLKSRDKSFDSPGEVRSVTENAITRGLDGEHDVKKKLDAGAGIKDLCDPLIMATPHHMSSTFDQLPTTATFTKIQVTDSASTHSMPTAESVSATTVTIVHDAATASTHLMSTAEPVSATTVSSVQATATASTHSIRTTEPWIGHKQGNSCNRLLPLFQTTVSVIFLTLFSMGLR